jgi:hypothetical protein
MTSASTQSIADIDIPDTPLVREITEYIRDTEDELLFNLPAGYSSSAHCKVSCVACAPTPNCYMPARCSMTSA